MIYYYDPTKVTTAQRDAAEAWLAQIEMMEKNSGGNLSKEQKGMLTSGFFAGTQYGNKTSWK